MKFWRGAMRHASVSVDFDIRCKVPGGARGAEREMSWVDIFVLGVDGML